MIDNQSSVSGTFSHGISYNIVFLVFYQFGI